MVVDLLSTNEAQELFDELPARDRVSTLRPDVLAAADPAGGELLHLLSRDARGFILTTVIENEIPGTNWYDWTDPHNYGGLVLSGEPDPARWAAFAAFARTRGVVAQFHRFHPLSDAHLLRQEVSRPDRLTVALPLDPGVDATTHFRPSAVGAFKKAVNAGVQIREAALSNSAFVDRYRDLMMAKKARAELLFDAGYFHRLELTGATLLLEAVAGEEVVGSILVLVGPVVSEYHLGESNAEGRRLGVTNLLLASAARIVGESGSRWLFLGGGADADPSNGLLRFKSSLSPHTFDFWVGGSVYDPAAFMKLPVRSPGRFLSYRD